MEVEKTIASSSAYSKFLVEKWVEPSSAVVAVVVVVVVVVAAVVVGSFQESLEGNRKEQNALGTYSIGVYIRSAYLP